MIIMMTMTSRVVMVINTMKMMISTVPMMINNMNIREGFK